jgi:hypothetical protein
MAFPKSAGGLTSSPEGDAPPHYHFIVSGCQGPFLTDRQAATRGDAAPRLRVHSLGPNEARMSVRMKTVTEDQRVPLVEEVQRLSGRRLRVVPSKPPRL